MPKALKARVKLRLLYYVTRNEGRIYKVYITSELRRRLKNVVAGMKSVVKNGMHCPIR